jgi:hypothetical protein
MSDLLKKLGIMNSESPTKFDLAFIAGAAIVLILFMYFLSAEQLRTISYMLLLTSYFIGRYVGKKLSTGSSED